jgi:hypothetical protein
MRATICIFLAFLTLPLAAAELRPVGVLGNSGYAGATLCRMQPGGYPGGVVMDEDLTLWHSAAADRLERLSLDGRVIAAFRVEGGRMGHPQHNIRVALVGDYVVELQTDSGQFFAMRREADPTQDAMKQLKLDPPIQFWYASGLGARGIGGRAIVDDGKAVYAVDPATGKTEKLFDLPERISENGLEVAPDGTIYLCGAHTRAFDVSGKELRSGPGMWARINWVPGALLALSWGGVQRAPESLASVTQLFTNSGQEIGRAGQVAPLGGDLIALAGEIGPVFLAHLSEERVDYFRRLGAITPQAVGLTAGGEVLAAGYGGLLVWRWGDPADACPFYTANFVNWLGHQQIATRGAWTWGIKQSYRESEPMQTWSWPPFRQYGLQYSTLGGERPHRPLGLAVTEDLRMFLSAEKERNLYQTRCSQEFGVDGNVKEVAWVGENPLTAPTDLAGWKQGRVAVADGSTVVMIEPAGEQYQEAWRFSSWGDQPDQKFGAELHLAIAGDLLLVSDTKRQRVLAFHLPDHALVARLGETDEAGTVVGAFDQPAQIAANGLRVVVYDRGNQRLVQCELRP